MQRISSSGTFFSKRVLPFAFLSFLGFFVYDSIAAVDDLPGVLVVVVGPVLMVAFGALMYRFFIAGLADEVVDHGSFLSVRNGGIEDRVYLDNIMNVSATQFVNPPRVTIRLITPGKFGREVAFSPKVEFSLNPLRKPKIVEELIERAHAARSRRAA